MTLDELDVHAAGHALVRIEPRVGPTHDLAPDEVVVAGAALRQISQSSQLIADVFAHRTRALVLLERERLPGRELRLLGQEVPTVRTGEPGPESLAGQAERLSLQHRPARRHSRCGEGRQGQAAVELSLRRHHVQLAGLVATHQRHDGPVADLTLGSEEGIGQEGLRAPRRRQLELDGVPVHDSEGRVPGILGTGPVGESVVDAQVQRHARLVVPERPLPGCSGGANRSTSYRFPNTSRTLSNALPAVATSSPAASASSPGGGRSRSMRTTS